MKRSATLALAALALASLCASASARALSSEIVEMDTIAGRQLLSGDKCDGYIRVKYSAYDQYTYDPKDWKCTNVKKLGCYDCCHAPLPEPKCWKVEDYTEYDPKYDDYVCKKVENKWGYYWDCCAKEPEPPCKKVDSYVPSYDDLWVCTPHDYHYISYHICCPKPLPPPECYKVEPKDYKGNEYTDWVCSEVTNGYESYWDCCAPEVKPPCEKIDDYVPNDYSNLVCTPYDYHYTSYHVCCPKPDPCTYEKYDSYGPKPEKYGYECVENYGPDGYDIINWKCCPVDKEPPTTAPTYDPVTAKPSRSQNYPTPGPKKTPAPTHKKTPAPTHKKTPAPTPKKTAKPQPPVCKTDKKQTCCIVDGKGKNVYKSKGYKCTDIRRSRGKYLCCKALPPPKPICFNKKINRRNRKCCYDPTKKIKKNRKYRCFYASYRGKKGDYCYKT